LPLNSLFASIFNECLSFSVVGPLSHDIVQKSKLVKLTL